jgi:glycosyltransferase involved in cell wall biosynthesis
VLVSTARMKVLHLVSRFRWTGCAEPAVNLCRHLRMAGADSRLCCVPGGSLESRARELGAEMAFAAPLGRDYAPWGILGAARSLARYVETEGIDLLHAHTSHDHWLAALSGSLFSQRPPPLVRTHHETRRIRAGKVWRRIFNRHTAMNVTVSAASRDYFEGRGAIRPGKLRLIHGGLDLARLAPSRPAPDVRGTWGVPAQAWLVAHLSHIGPDRRQDEMLEAFSLVAEEFPKAWLVFLGEGNKSTVRLLRSKVQARSFRDRVVLGRDFTAKNIPWPDQIAAVDQVAVLAVGSEGSSRGVMEAMALGKPVAGARVGVLPELMEEGKTGWLVEAGDPVSLAGALRDGMGNPQRCARMGAAAATTIRTRFRCERQARETLELYREILGSSPGKLETRASSR